MFRGLKGAVGLPLVLVVVFFGLALLFDACSSDSDEETEAPPAIGSLSDPAAAQSDLSQVDDFLYQLQDLDLAAVGESRYDLVIMDYAADGTADSEYSAADISSLRASPGGPKVLLAYMSIGEAEDYRFYWQDPLGDRQA